MTTPTTVLVVEDDPSVRGLLETLLLAEGYEVSTAGDGIAGLVKASAQRPSLIVLDVVMPDLGGVRVLEELERTEGLEQVPVIVVTGKSEIIGGLRDRLGEDRVFLKPFAVHEFLARVSDITGGPVRQA